MSVDDHGLEVLKKSGEEITPGDKSEYRIKTRVTESVLPDGASTSALQNDPKFPAKILIDSVPFWAPLTTGAADEAMTKDGSVTPVVFTHTFAQTTYIDSIQFVIKDSGNANPDNFGSIPILTNGILISIFKNATVYNIATLKTNMGLVRFFNHHGVIPGTSNGFLNENDAYIGTKIFSVPVLMTTSDQVRINVRDNLTAVDNMRSSISGWYLI